MIRFLALLFLLSATGQVWGQSLVATGLIRSQQVIGPGDVALIPSEISGALRDPAAAIGQEARVNLYPDRPIRAADLQPPALVDRNEIVTLRYHQNGLLIVTEGRVLDRAAEGDRVRVLNLASRSTVIGRVIGPGLVAVGG